MPPASRSAPLLCGPRPESRSPKSRGEMGEARFLARAIELGLAVARPWGDSLKYDFIVDTGCALCRVQVKTAFAVGPRGAYYITAAFGADAKQPYTREHIDVLAVYIAPEDVWYIIPVEEFSPRVSLRFFPQRASERFRRNREAWHWMVSENLCPAGRSRRS